MTVRGWLVSLWLVGLGVGWAGSVVAEPDPPLYDARGRRDPLEALVTPTGEIRTPRSGTAVGTLHVDGIMWDASNPLAIVNGRIRRVGDEVEGYRIRSIRRDAIVVEGGEHGTVIVPVIAEELPSVQRP